jgi:predicted nucleotidyltransferase
MVEAVDRVVTPFLTAADTALGERYSAVLYGSGARGDFVPGRSDVNLILVAEELSPATLRALGGAFAAWRKSRLEPPLLITSAEWARATDVFPIEIADMRAGYRVLRGADPLEGVVAAPADLRQALEREFRGKLLRLRQGYAAAAGDPATLGTLAIRSAATMMVLLRGLLTLMGRGIPKDPLQLAVAGAEALGVDSEPLLLVLRHRGDAAWRCPPESFEPYMDIAARATRFLDQLHPGDQ